MTMNMITLLTDITPKRKMKISSEACFGRKYVLFCNSRLLIFCCFIVETQVSNILSRKRFEKYL